MGRPARRGLRGVTFVVVAVLLVVAVGLAVIVRSVVHDQEDRLLGQRAKEAGAYVQNATDSLSTSLLAASGLALLSPTPEAFGAVIGQLPGVLQQVVLVGLDGDTATVLASAAEELPVGATLGEPRVSVLREASEGMVVTPVIAVGESRRLGFGVAVPGREGQFVYLEFSFDLAQSAVDPDQPFADLDAALYAGPDATTDELVVVTGDTDAPMQGEDVGRASFPVGQTRWLLEVRSNTSLVGNVATNTPWIVLVSGMAVALMTGALVEVLARRQAYAVGLVAARTAELEAAQDELRAADAMKDEFLANVSHELRTPLTAVAGFSELLLGPAADDEASRRKLLEGIARNATDMSGMVEQLLDFARLTAGRIPFDPHPTDLRACVDAAVATATPAMGQEIRIDVPSGLVVNADEDGLRHILGNLLSNAGKFSPPSEPVEIVARVEGDHVVIRVIDGGPGVSPEVAATLFERFVQGEHQAPERRSRGLGLGLAIAKRHVELHGGRIWFDPDSRRGASVAFTVPVAS